MLNLNQQIKKIYFPKEIIPLPVVFSNLINFLLELTALFIVLAIMGYKFYMYLYLLPLVILIQLFLVAGCTLLVSSLNVFFRDLQHLITIIMSIHSTMKAILIPLSKSCEKKGLSMKKMMPSGLRSPNLDTSRIELLSKRQVSQPIACLTLPIIVKNSGVVLTGWWMSLVPIILLRFPM